jgi:hypothetical protein
VKKLGNGKILVGDVGTGKSLVAAAYYRDNEAPRDVVVITTAKKRNDLDWEREFAKLGVSMSGSVFGGPELTVDSWNNIGKYVDAVGRFFIFDEQRLVGTGAWTKAFYKISKANGWILLSATPGDVWLDYAPVFIANGFYKNITQFRDEHVVYKPHSKFPKVLRYNGSGRLVRLRNQLLVEMPYLRHTTRHITWVDVEYDIDLVEKVTKHRWNVFTQRPLKDMGELYRVARKIVNQDHSRLEAVRSLSLVHPRLIVFYNFDYELEELRTLFESPADSTPSSPGPTSSVPSGTRSRTSSGSTSSTSEERSQHHTSLSGQGEVGDTLNEGVYPETVIAEYNGHRHDPVPRCERWVYLVQYIAGHDGWNCVSTDAMIFYSLPYSHRMFFQAHGRIDRMNTRYSELYYYVLFSRSWIDQAIRKSLKAKKNFHESQFGPKFNTEKQSRKEAA